MKWSSATSQYSSGSADAREPLSFSGCDAAHRINLRLFLHGYDVARNLNINNRR